MGKLRVYIVSYDISDSKRLYRVHKTMKGFGEPVHYSVFRCNLSDKDKIELIAILSEIIKHDEDRIMIIDLGFLDGYVDRRISLIGVHPEEDNNESAIIV
ncbi:CRISPR-associated endonuclease Cas2 [Methanomicrobium antiquum]|uniref:CRISPR-associated endoribonuclease Cas2 n=1 Tax=Methanomicrobium antiquum TaxID=487686 RepID=A0AAF0JTK9_9EURY|nr:CRISPR-associated endonuclease Cas2 [Methanomicrobium antiquum]WFN36463.1 CRISPR-associated endonuclease Cas2 [Methanomicrobium antiquum]